MSNTLIGKMLKLAKLEHKIDIIEFSIVILFFSFLVIKAGGATTILGFALALLFFFVVELFLTLYFKKRMRNLTVEVSEERTRTSENYQVRVNDFHKNKRSELKNILMITSCILGSLLIVAIVFCILYFKTWIINRWTRPVLIVLFLVILIPQIYMAGLINSLSKSLHNEKNRKLTQ